MSKTVAVLGGSYGGYRAAQVLAAGLPTGWRVVLVDRNSHFNHVYNLPRYTVLFGHEHKAFIPYDNLFDNPHTRIHGSITRLHPHHVTYTTPASTPLEHTVEETLDFDYAIYALGSHLPSPIDLWSTLDARSYTGTKQDGISWLCSRQRRIDVARHVLVVGGGALGIQFASDIAAIYPLKSVTLLHSRSKLLPRFDEALGDQAYQGLQELGVHVIFDERLDPSSLDAARAKGFENQETMSIKTTKGRDIEADLVLLCTGQVPNTSILYNMDSRTIDPNSGMVRVSRTMQILALEEQDTTLPSTLHTQCSTPLVEPPYTIETFVDDARVYPHLFAVGDVADAFGASKAGHTAYYQGEVAARNIIQLVKGAENLSRGLEEDLELEEYVPGPPMIKVSLGLTKSAYEVAGVVGTKDDGIDDLGATAVWGAFGYKNVDEEGMWR